MGEGASHLSLCNIVRENKLHELGLNEPSVISLSRGDLGAGDFVWRAHLAAYVGLESNGYKVMDFRFYESEAVAVVRKTFWKWAEDFMIGGSRIEEFQRVYDAKGENGFVCVYSSFIKEGSYTDNKWRGITFDEERVVEAYPELVQQSPFYYSVHDLNRLLPEAKRKTLHKLE